MNEQATAEAPADERARPPNSMFLSASASIGKKVVMATTGSILVLYVIAHLLGNLQIFQSPEAVNDYAEFLKSKPGFLWSARAVLLAAAILHVVVGTLLWLQNRRARPVAYAAGRRNDQSTFASRNMIWTGAILAAFIVYHILHLTVGAVGPTGYRFEMENVYRNIVKGFSDPVIAILYIAGMFFLYFHLTHGIQSLFLTFGFSHPKYERSVIAVSKVLAFLLAAGNILIVVAVLAGLIGGNH